MRSRTGITDACLCQTTAATSRTTTGPQNSSVQDPVRRLSQASRLAMMKLSAQAVVFISGKKMYVSSPPSSPELTARSGSFCQALDRLWKRRNTRSKSCHKTCYKTCRVQLVLRFQVWGLGKDSREARRSAMAAEKEEGKDAALLFGNQPQ